MTESEQIGLRLDEIRKTLSLSQQELAQHLGVSKSFISSVLSGKRGIGMEIILGAAKRYQKLNIRWLLTGVGSMWEDPNYIPPTPAPEFSQVKEPSRKYLASNDRITRIEKMLLEHGRRIAALEGGISIKMKK